MRMPEIDNNIRHYNPKTMVFGGLNLTHDTHDGEFADTKCITTTGYPWLQTVPDSAIDESFLGLADDVFIWDGDVYTVLTNNGETKLWKNDDEIGAVAPGLKQMAVVNTKLVIYPDKVYVDMTDDTMHSLGTNVPDLDYICASENRLWGVSNADKTIYVSALGDPASFFDYSGDSGSYSVAVGSEGDFTGICAFGGSVLVWKENLLHKVLGSFPSEYYTIDYPIYGVQKGSSKSLVVINNVLYYKGVYGIYQYGGNRPLNISGKLGNGIYTDAVASGDADNYYIGMADPSGAYHLYVYDIKRGLWVKRYDRQMISAATSNMTAYFISPDKYGNNVLYTVSEHERANMNTEWMAELIEVTEDTFDRKGYTKLNVRLDMAEYSTLQIYAKEDRRAYRKIWEMTNPVRKYYVQSQEIDTDHGNIDVQIDTLPEEGDTIVFQCVGFDDFVTTWQKTVWPDNKNLEAEYLIDDNTVIDAFCYTDPEAPEYGTILIGHRGLNGHTISVWSPDGENNPVTQIVPIRLGRCDRWQLKFEGTGDVTIRGIQKDFVTGSEK